WRELGLRDDIPVRWELRCVCGERVRMGWWADEDHKKGGFWWPKSCEACEERRKEREYEEAERASDGATGGRHAELGSDVRGGRDEDAGEPVD
ncbi:MAG: hypothetical protein ACRDJE_07285, partial [Dehalococcoidia bacterium]